ncbi:MAG: acyl-CoA synthetase [Methyloligellaceae bacterium]
MSQFDTGLEKTPANFQPLTPLSFLERAAKVFPSHAAVIHGQRAFSYRDLYERACRLASALAARGIKKNETVTVMLANTPAMIEAHYGVPMSGAVLHPINTRLDAAVIAFQLDHAESKIVIIDREFSAAMREALTRCQVKPLVIDYIDPEFDLEGERIGDMDYEAFLASGDPEHQWTWPHDEWDAIALNYTSGTTGNPKGVVYHHRGAYLMGYANIIAAQMGMHPVYLWTLPMFHCCGWCFPWSLSVVAGTHICLRWVRAGPIYAALAEHNVSHLCGAPIVMSTILAASPEERRRLSRKVNFLTAAAPPPEAVLAKMAAEGFEVIHVYGLTEVYGPAVVNEWNADWNSLDPSEQAKVKARQGVRYTALEDLKVLDPESLRPTPADGESLGEVMFRGNIVMKGYLKNPDATRAAFVGGWFHSGDLGVTHADGYIQLKDRSKDIIISGGENISSIEVEDVLYKVPGVQAVAVVAKPDEKWGETACAFIETTDGSPLSASDVIAYCRENLAHFKCPKHVVFTELPKTSTGKIQKFKLREMAKDV